MTLGALARGLGLAALVVVSASAARAGDDVATYPNRPVHIIVPAAAGGGIDVLTRLIGQKLTATLGQPVVIDNKPGAATILGTAEGAHAAPNGYTLVNAPMAAMAVNPAVYDRLPYAPRDLAPVSLVASYPLILVVNKDVPVHSVKELVAYAKANPTKVNAGGASATFQLATELFKQKTGTPIEYIAYKGSNNTVTSVMSGEITMAIVDAGPVSAQLKAGRVRGLAVTSAARMAAFPDLPTMAEAGIPGMVVLSWAGIFAPAGTPQPIIKKLQDGIISAAKQPDVQAKMHALDLDPAGDTAEDFAHIIADDVARWSAVAKAANIKLKL